MDSAASPPTVFFHLFLFLTHIFALSSLFLIRFLSLQDFFCLLINQSLLFPPLIYFIHSFITLLPLPLFSIIPSFSLDPPNLVPSYPRPCLSFSLPAISFFFCFFFVSFSYSFLSISSPSYLSLSLSLSYLCATLGWQDQPQLYFGRTKMSATIYE